MRFLSLEVDNFQSIQHVSVPLSNQGLVLLDGKNLDTPALDSNGAGKSSLIEALVYALYGHTTRGLSGDKVVNRKAGKDMRVTLSIEDDSGHSVVISRYRKHKQFKNATVILMDNKDITPKSEAQANAWIVAFLDMEYTVFVASILFSAGSFKFTSETDAGIKRTFEQMLDLGIYSAALSETRQRMAVVRASIAESKSTVKQLHDKLMDLSARKSKAQQQHDSWEDSLTAQIHSANAAIDETHMAITEWTNKLGELKQQQQQARDKIVALQTELSKLGDYATLKEALDKLTNAIRENHKAESSLTLEASEHRGKVVAAANYKDSLLKRLGDDTTAIESLKQKQADTLSTVGAPCPVCGRVLERSHLDAAINEIQREIDKRSQSAELTQNAIDAQQRIINSSSRAEARVQEQYNTVIEDTTRLAALQHKVSLAMSDITDKRDEITSAREALNRLIANVSTADGQISVLQSTLARQHEVLKKLENSTNPFGDILTLLSEQIQEATSEHGAACDHVQQYESTLAVLQYWEHAFGNAGIKSLLLDNVVPFLNKTANEYLSALSGGTLEVELSTQTTLSGGEQRDKFSITLHNAFGGESYASNSGGERKRADLAINAAMQALVASRSRRSLNFTIWDEAFDALDNTGCENVVQMLQQMAMQKETIIVVTHNAHLQSYFPTVWTMVKKDGMSTLEE